LKPTRIQIWKAWIPAILWLGVIALESSELGGSDHTSRFLYPLVHFLFRVDPFHFETWHHYIRKTGHFVGYALLSWFLFRAWRATLPLAARVRWSFQWAAIAFFMTAFVATMDEWHQSFLPSRTGRWQDVVLDSFAALTLQVFLWTVLRGRPQSSSQRSD
jgi:VanZ family protein